MAEEIILKVGVEGTGQGEQKIKSLKAQLKDMKNELLGLDEGSDRFKKLSREAAQLEDKIGDVNQKVKALSSDTKRLDALVGVGSAIAGGFQAAQGAMALFGSDSKKVEKAIQNIIAVQGVLNGVQQVGQFLTSKGIVQDALANAAMVAKAGVIKVVTAAQWLWNAAVTANPIGIIVVGIAAMTAGIVALIRGLKNGTITIQDINKVLWRMIMPLQLIVDLYKYLTNALSENETALEKNSKIATATYNRAVAEAENRRRIEKKAFEERQGQFDLTIARLDAEGKSTVELTRQKLQAIIDEKKAVLQHNIDLINLMVARYETEAALRGKSLDQFLKDLNINKEQTQKIIEDQLQVQKDAIYSAETDLIKFNTDTRNKSIQENKSKNDELLRQEQERLKQEQDAAQKAFDAEMERQRRLLEQKNDAIEQIIETENAYEDSQLSQQEREINAVNDKYFQLIESAKQYGLDTVTLEQARQAELQNIQDAADAELEKKEQEKLEKKAQMFKNYSDSVLKLTETIFTLTNAYGKQDEESKEKRAKRQFQINKALQLSLAVMDGYKAVTASLAQSPVAIGPIPNPAGIASLAFAVTTSLANIAKIAATKYQSSGASIDVGSPSISSAGDGVQGFSDVPKVQGVPSGSTLLNSEQQKVVVVESDITKVQKKVSVIEAANTYG